MSRHQIFHILCWPRDDKGRLTPPDPDPLDAGMGRLEELCLRRGLPRWYWPQAIRKYRGGR